MYDRERERERESCYMNTLPLTVMHMSFGGCWLQSLHQPSIDCILNTYRNRIYLSPKYYKTKKNCNKFSFITEVGLYKVDIFRLCL